VAPAGPLNDPVDLRTACLVPEATVCEWLVFPGSALPSVDPTVDINISDA